MHAMPGRLPALVVLLSTVILVPAPAGAGSKRNPKSRIKHIVVVMMENRSFDHLLGWHPTADARQEGLAYPDGSGGTQLTWHLTDFQGCGHPEPDHSWLGAREEYAGGDLDGFLTAGDNDAFAIGYYTEQDRPFTSALARNFTTLDRFFASVLGPTFPNRMFLYAAQTDRLENTLDLSALPTIFDRLLEKQVTVRYYPSDFSFLLLWGAKYVPITSPYEQFLAEAASGRLPQVSFVDPRFLGDDIGIGGSDHPFSDIREGDAFLARTFDAVASGPDWPGTIFIVIYDEWGGFFDHVAPPRAAAPNDVDPDIVDGKTLLGFRVPAIVASPFTRGNPDEPRVVSSVFDHTSVLKLIEWRWNIDPLTARDASDDVGSLLEALDLKAFDPTVPDLPAVDSPPIHPCP